MSFTGAKDEWGGGGGGNWSCKTRKAPVKSSPPTNHHPNILQTGCPSCRPTNSVRAVTAAILQSQTSGWSVEIPRRNSSPREDFDSLWSQSRLNAVTAEMNLVLDYVLLLLNQLVQFVIDVRHREWKPGHQLRLYSHSHIQHARDGSLSAIS